MNFPRDAMTEAEGINKRHQTQIEPNRPSVIKLQLTGTLIRQHNQGFLLYLLYLSKQKMCFYHECHKKAMCHFEKRIKMTHKNRL